METYKPHQHLKKITGYLKVNVVIKLPVGYECADIGPKSVNGNYEIEFRVYPVSYEVPNPVERSYLISWDGNAPHFNVKSLVKEDGTTKGEVTNNSANADTT